MARDVLDGLDIGSGFYKASNKNMPYGMAAEVRDQDRFPVLFRRLFFPCRFQTFRIQSMAWLGSPF